jgi:hypothetical protein
LKIQRFSSTLHVFILTEQAAAKRGKTGQGEGVMDGRKNRAAFTKPLNRKT